MEENELQRALPVGTILKSPKFDYRIEAVLGQGGFGILKSASNLNGNLNCSKELEHYAS